MVQSDIYQLIHLKREEIIRLAGKYGASHIRIFGSVAHHTADEKSDIDFLVELEPGRTLFDLGGFGYDLEKLLGRPVDVCTVPLLRESIRTRVVSEAVPLCEWTCFEFSGHRARVHTKNGYNPLHEPVP